MGDETVYDGGKTVLEEDGTILEGHETVLEEDGTVLEKDGTALEEYGTLLEETGTILEEEDRTVFEEDGEYLSKVSEKEVTEDDFRKENVLLDTYRVESDAFKGGMGAVWKVKHIRWNMDLAVKRPKPEMFQTQQQVENFIAECKNWIELGLHPNIVSCYYVRELGGVPTIFSEWMENGDLSSHIKDESLYEGTDEEVQRRLLDIAIQFGRGLAYAHQKQLIHQDVKPDNLLLTKNWEAKVSDFGIAKARSFIQMENEMDAGEYGDVTQMSPAGGRTPAYCSPEQAKSIPLTIRTDVYSWAVSILEMYMGTKPWAHGRELTGPLVGVACEDYFDMCRVEMPQELRELLKQCLEQEPEKRPHDFMVIEESLKAIYRTVTGNGYPRTVKNAVGNTPEILNNMALSYLDMGMITEAKSCLYEATRSNEKGADIAGYNKSILENWQSHITDIKRLIDRNPAWLLYKAAQGDVRIVRECFEKWNGSYPEIIEPFVEELESKILNGKSGEPRVFQAKAGWLYPSGKYMLLVDAKSGKLNKHDTETGQVVLSFEAPPEENMKESIFLYASRDEKLVYAVNGHWSFVETDPVKHIGLQKGNYYLHIWNGEGTYLRSIRGPELRVNAERAGVVTLQGGRYLVCEKHPRNWFWDLRTEKCFLFKYLNKWNVRGEKRFSFQDLESGEEFLSLEDAPVFENLERSEEDRLDGMEKFLKHEKVNYDYAEWTQTLYSHAIPGTDLIWNVKKKSSQKSHLDARFYWLECAVVRLDGVVNWRAVADQISADDCLRQFMTSDCRREVRLYRLEDLPERFRAPYLICKVHSVEEYLNEDDLFAKLEREMGQKVMDGDLKGAMEILEKARTYRDKGYALRIAELGRCVASIATPKNLCNKTCLTLGDVYATLSFLDRTRQKIRNHVYGRRNSNQKYLGKAWDMPFVEYGMTVMGNGDVYEPPGTELLIYSEDGKGVSKTITLPGKVVKVFVLREEETMLAVLEDPLYLPLEPEFRKEKVEITLENGKKKTYTYKIHNKGKAAECRKLYEVDLFSGKCTLIGKGLGEYFFQTRDPKTKVEIKHKYLSGRISIMDRLEVNIESFRDIAGHGMSLRNVKTGEVYDEWRANDVSISDDGTFLIEGSHLYVLEWNWEEKKTQSKTDPVEIHIDVEEYKSFVERERGLIFAKEEKKPQTAAKGNEPPMQEEPGKPGFFAKLFGKKN